MASRKFQELLHRNRAELQRLWAQRLQQEYENIAYCHRLKLRRPVIALVALEGKWGQWSPETRTLSLSIALIEKYPWEVVLEILKHEMAHQIVTDLFGSEDGHGEDFRRACQLLGMAEWAARASGDLPDGYCPWKSETLDDADERLLRRVEKLLALATSSNEHEAGQAMAKVQELYAKYNLERLEAKRESGHVYLLIHHRSRRIPRHQAMIGSLLNDFFFVKIIYTVYFDASSGDEYKALELLGTRENVLMAEYVYHFLWSRLPHLWENYRSTVSSPLPRNYRRKGDLARRQRASYYSGVLAGFRDQLEQSSRAMARSLSETSRPPDCRAMVALEDPALDAFVGYRYPRLVNIRRGGTSYDADSYQAGREEGLRLVLNRAIQRADGNQGKLLR